MVLCKPSSSGPLLTRSELFDCKNVADSQEGDHSEALLSALETLLLSSRGVFPVKKNLLGSLSSESDSNVHMQLHVWAATVNEFGSHGNIPFGSVTLLVFGFL